MPLSKATIAVLVLYYALGHWNDWFRPMIYLQDVPKKYAVIVVSTVPMLIFYPFIQKYFEKGVMIGGVKG